MFPRTSEIQRGVKNEGQRDHGILRVKRHVGRHTCVITLGELREQVGNDQLKDNDDQPRMSHHGGQYDNHGQFHGSPCAKVPTVSLIREGLRDDTLKASQHASDQSVHGKSVNQDDRKL